MRSLPFAKGLAGLALALSLMQGPAAAADPARRVVSLNICTDELLLRLADPHKIGSVTWLSRNPSGSNVADLARQVPINHGLAEQVVASDPDLVLAGTYTTRVAIGMLKRTAIPIIEFDIPRSFDDVRRQIREVAALVQAEQRGRQLIADFDRRLTAIAAKPRTMRPTAVVLNPNGTTVGPDTLADAVMTAAGLDNLAAKLQTGNYGQIPLEVVALHEVDVLIVSASRDGPPSNATELLRHPILSKLKRTRVMVLPGRLWSCGGPGVAEAVERLDAVAAEVVRAKSPQ